jgi:hypothetical protein
VNFSLDLSTPLDLLRFCSAKPPSLEMTWELCGTRFPALLHKMSVILSGGKDPEEIFSESLDFTLLCKASLRMTGVFGIIS